MHAASSVCAIAVFKKCGWGSGRANRRLESRFEIHLSKNGTPLGPSVTLHLTRRPRRARCPPSSPPRLRAKLPGARARRAAATRRCAIRARRSRLRRAPKTPSSDSRVARPASALGSAALTLTSAPPAHAMEGIFANPAVLGATCVMVCWGIPQTLGMAVARRRKLPVAQSAPSGGST